MDQVFHSSPTFLSEAWTRYPCSLCEGEEERHSSLLKHLQLRIRKIHTTIYNALLNVTYCGCKNKDDFIFIFLRILCIYFQRGGKEAEREGEKHPCERRT